MFKTSAVSSDQTRRIRFVAANVSFHRDPPFRCSRTDRPRFGAPDPPATRCRRTYSTS